MNFRTIFFSYKLSFNEKNTDSKNPKDAAIELRISEYALLFQ